MEFGFQATSSDSRFRAFSRCLLPSPLPSPPFPLLPHALLHLLLLLLPPLLLPISSSLAMAPLPPSPSLSPSQQSCAGRSYRGRSGTETGLREGQLSPHFSPVSLMGHESPSFWPFPSALSFLHQGWNPICIYSHHWGAECT